VFAPAPPGVTYTNTSCDHDGGAGRAAGAAQHYAPPPKCTLSLEVRHADRDHTGRHYGIRHSPGGSMACKGERCTRGATSPRSRVLSRSQKGTARNGPELRVSIPQGELVERAARKPCLFMNVEPTQGLELKRRLVDVEDG